MRIKKHELKSALLFVLLFSVYTSLTLITALTIRSQRGDGIAHAQPPPWTRARAPSTGLPESLGFYARGCLQGAEALPSEGTGFKSIRRHRRRYYGHPTTIALIKRLGVEVKRLKLSPLEIGDLSMPRGGKMPYGHASHQSGLDADVWFGVDTSLERSLKRERQRLRKRAKAEKWTRRKRRAQLFEIAHPSLIKGRDERLNTDVWSSRHSQVLEFTAKQPEVARIFIHFRIKEAMCAHYRRRKESQDEPAPLWLRKLRPWYGHHQHFHIRLKCPQGSPNCEAQGPLPEGPGCEGLSWFSRAEKQARRVEERRAETEEAKRVAKLSVGERAKHKARIAELRRAKAKKRREKRDRLIKLCQHLTPGAKSKAKKSKAKKSKAKKSKAKQSM